MSGGYKELSGVYTIFNKLTNKTYIGSCSTSIIQRWSNHRNELKRGIHANTYLQRSWNKYGEDNFIFEILEECLPEYCTSTEQYWMNMLNVCNRKFGYNLAPVAGSSLGQKRTKEQCKNISNSVKGKRVGKLNPNYGKKCSEITKERMSNTSRNKAVIKLDLNNNIIQEYKSLSEAGKANNLYPDHIGKVCKNKPNHLTAGGFKWKYKN